MDSFACELGLSFDIRIESPHVIQPSQCLTGVVPYFEKSVLKCDYKNMLDPSFQDMLGRAILKQCEVIPGGILCFFSSYRNLNMVVARWKSQGLHDGVSFAGKKEIFIENSSHQTFNADLKLYRNANQKCCTPDGNQPDADRNDGAIFFCVAKGKCAEGLNFCDENARAVIIVGVPYASEKDPVHGAKIRLKKKYNDENLESMGISGNLWYEQEAHRTVNQAIGRCIRHKLDWGVILLLDQRYLSDKATQMRPSWMQKSLVKVVPDQLLDIHLTA